MVLLTAKWMPKEAKPTMESVCAWFCTAGSNFNCSADKGLRQPALVPEMVCEIYGQPHGGEVKTENEAYLAKNIADLFSCFHNM